MELGDPRITILALLPVGHAALLKLGRLYANLHILVSEVHHPTLFKDFGSFPLGVFYRNNNPLKRNIIAHRWSQLLLIAVRGRRTWRLADFLLATSARRLYFTFRLIMLPVGHIMGQIHLRETF